jgi:hypothetical protein
VGVYLRRVAAPQAVTGIRKCSFVYFESKILGIKKIKFFDAAGNLDAGGDDKQLIFLWGLICQTLSAVWNGSSRRCKSGVAIGRAKQSIMPRELIDIAANNEVVLFEFFCQSTVL